MPQWSADATVQYNPKTEHSIRSTIGARYNPGNYRVVSAAYRLQRGQSEQIDVGWQWPLNDLWGDKGQDLGPRHGPGRRRWYSVGRLNYSLQDQQAGRCDPRPGVRRRLLDRARGGGAPAKHTSSANKRILFQLEFVGFTRLGSNALQPLRQNIPRYQYLRERVRHRAASATTTEIQHR